MTRRAPRLTKVAPVVVSTGDDDGDIVCAEALPWLTDYLAQPHPQIGRDGAVCPFVEPSLVAGSLHMRVDRIGPDADQDTIRKLVHDMVTCFEHTAWEYSNATLHALVAVLPNLIPAQYPLLDRVQAEVKPHLADQGLMLGQFHPDCPDRAARNPDFLVGRAPVAMLALRRMAFHDIMFLHRDPTCFAAYERRFGERYRTGKRIDPLFAETFRRALATHGGSSQP